MLELRGSGRGVSLGGCMGLEVCVREVGGGGGGRWRGVLWQEGMRVCRAGGVRGAGERGGACPGCTAVCAVLCACTSAVCVAVCACTRLCVCTAMGGGGG